ncbi:MAG TPA: formylmethanofuran dehydrogenase subunit E family protein [Methanomassiliicoccales archaeon]|nr:formylmethanofuran dehydrogenase subunit E family protein [Methanomassiliicoccales archaeon]
MDSLPDELKQLKRFHGHLGPYVVVGYRMGLIARHRLEGKLWAVSFTGPKPPMSCVVDGIQFSSGCTLGKGNISIQERGEAKAHFFNEKQLLEIALRPEIKERIDSTMNRETEEIVAMGLYNEREETLFAVTEVESDLHERALKLR